MDTVFKAEILFGWFDNVAGEQYRELIHTFRGAFSPIAPANYFYLYAKSIGADWQEKLFNFEKWE